MLMVERSYIPQLGMDTFNLWIGFDSPQSRSHSSNEGSESSVGVPIGRNAVLKDPTR